MLVDLPGLDLVGYRMSIRLRERPPSDADRVNWSPADDRDITGKESGVANQVLTPSGMADVE